MEQKKAGTNYVYRTEGEYVQLTEAEKDRRQRIRAAGAGWEGRSTLYKDFYKKMQTTDAFTSTADDFIDLLTADNADQLFAAGGDMRGLMERVGYHGRSLFGGGHEEVLAEDFEKFGNSKRLEDMGVSWNTLTSDKKALIMELGYALATQREGGRLTDQDVERAIISLGVDNPDPRSIAWIFGRALKRTRDNWADNLRNSGLRDLDAVRSDHKVTLDGLNNAINRLEERYAIDFESETAFESFTPPGTIKTPKDSTQRGRGAVRVREVG